MPRLLFTLFLITTLAHAERFGYEHVGKLVRVSDPQIAPHGKSIVVLVSRANFEDNRSDAELVLVDIATRNQRVLTSGRGRVSAARWSPNGDRLAFLAPPAGGKPQIYVMPMSGGDAIQLTKAPEGVQQFAWSPDGARIAFTTTDEAAKVTGPERHNDVFEVGNDDFLTAAAPRPTHLWIISAAGEQAKRITSGTWSLPRSLPPSPPSSPVSWSPDGRSIAIVKTATPHSGDGHLTAIQIVDVATGKVRPLTGNSLFESQPVIAPDGKQVAYWYPRDGESRHVNEIHVAPLAGGPGRSLTRAIDRNLMRALWMPDSQSLLVGGNDGTSVGLWIQPLQGAAARRLSLGKVVPASPFWVDVAVGANRSIAFTGSEPLRPAELYYMASESAPVQRLTGFNDAITALELGKTETIQWDGPNGFRPDAVLTYPPGFDLKQKYPLVLYIHGGPRSASKEAFNSRAQLLAARGWVVFEPNYRGSDNLGDAFQAAIHGDAGEGPGRDVMSGVEVLKKRGFVDETRMAPTGWSYGGYMTTWLIGHYQVWKAAVAGASVTSWMDQYNLGDANVRRGLSMGGSPWKDGRDKEYMAQSPIQNAHLMRTPTLILATTGDYRVPITQSYQLFHALKDNGVPTRFFAYPVSGHSPTDPVRQRDVDRRWIGWLEEYLGPGGASGGH